MAGCEKWYTKDLTYIQHNKEQFNIHNSVYQTHLLEKDIMYFIFWFDVVHKFFFTTCLVTGAARQSQSNLLEMLCSILWTLTHLTHCSQPHESDFPFCSISREPGRCCEIMTSLVFSISECLFFFKSPVTIAFSHFQAFSLTNAIMLYVLDGDSNIKTGSDSMTLDVI